MGAVNAWTAVEDALIRQYYPTEGDAVAKRLPGRSVFACRARAHFLRVYRVQARSWTSAEDATLRKYYPLEGKEVYKRLPGRTATACASRANQLGFIFRSPVWSDDEDAVIRKYYPLEGKEVYKRLKWRTAEACVARAKLLGVHMLSSAWTNDEDIILSQYYPSEGVAVAQRLPGRTPSACASRASILGVQCRSDYWSQEEKDLLIQLHNEGKPWEGMFPGRSKQAISGMRRKLGLVSGTSSWSDEDLDFLRREYSRLGPRVVAEKLGRTYASVTSMANKLWLPRATSTPRNSGKGTGVWTAEEDRILLQFRDKPVNAVLRFLPKHSALEVERRRKELGLRMSSRTDWSFEEDEILRRYYPVEGAAVKTRLTGRSEQSCVQRAHILGVRFKVS